MERRAQINNLTAKNNFKLELSTPHMITLGRKVTFPTYVSTSGMTGVISVRKRRHTQIIRKSLDVYWGLPKEKVMRCVSGF